MRVGYISVERRRGRRVSILRAVPDIIKIDYVLKASKVADSAIKFVY